MAKKKLTPRQRAVLKKNASGLRQERMGDYRYSSDVVDTTWNKVGKRAANTGRALTRSNARQMDAIQKLYSQSTRGVAAVQNDLGDAVQLYGGVYSDAARRAYTPAQVLAQTGVDQLAVGSRIARTALGTTAGLTGLMQQSVEMAQAGAQQATADALAEQAQLDATLLAEQRMQLLQQNAAVAAQEDQQAHELQMQKIAQNQAARDKAALENGTPKEKQAIIKSISEDAPGAVGHFMGAFQQLKMDAAKAAGKESWDQLTPDEQASAMPTFQDVIQTDSMVALLAEHPADQAAYTALLGRFWGAQHWRNAGLQEKELVDFTTDFIAEEYDKYLPKGGLEKTARSVIANSAKEAMGLYASSENPAGAALTNPKRGLANYLATNNGLAPEDRAKVYAADATFITANALFHGVPGEKTMLSPASGLWKKSKGGATRKAGTWLQEGWVRQKYGAQMEVLNQQVMTASQLGDDVAAKQAMADEIDDGIKKLLGQIDDDIAKKGLNKGAAAAAKTSAVGKNTLLQAYQHDKGILESAITKADDLVTQAKEGGLVYDAATGTMKASAGTDAKFAAKWGEKVVKFTAEHPWFARAGTAVKVLGKAANVVAVTQTFFDSTTLIGAIGDTMAADASWREGDTRTAVLEAMQAVDPTNKPMSREEFEKHLSENYSFDDFYTAGLQESDEGFGQGIFGISFLFGGKSGEDEAKQQAENFRLMALKAYDMATQQQVDGYKQLLIGAEDVSMYQRNWVGKAGEGLAKGAGSTAHWLNFLD